MTRVSFESHGRIMRYAVLCLRNALRTRRLDTFYVTMVAQQFRDGLRCLVSRSEDARALAAAWGHKITTGLSKPYGPVMPDNHCYCVECLVDVPTDYCDAHNGRCWHCEHVVTHAKPSIVDYFESMYQERA